MKHFVSPTTGRTFRRHLFFDGHPDSSYMALLGVVATGNELADKKTKIIPLGILHQVVYYDPEQLKKIAKDWDAFVGKLKLFANTKDYSLVHSSEGVLIGIKLNKKQFAKTTKDWNHQLYILGSTPSEGYDLPWIKIPEGNDLPVEK